MSFLKLLFTISLFFSSLETSWAQECNSCNSPTSPVKASKEVVQSVYNAAQSVLKAQGISNKAGVLAKDVSDLDKKENEEIESATKKLIERLKADLLQELKDQTTKCRQAAKLQITGDKSELIVKRLSENSSSGAAFKSLSAKELSKLADVNESDEVLNHVTKAHFDQKENQQEVARYVAEEYSTQKLVYLSEHPKLKQDDFIKNLTTTVSIPTQWAGVSRHAKSASSENDTGVNEVDFGISCAEMSNHDLIESAKAHLKEHNQPALSCVVREKNLDAPGDPKQEPPKSEPSSVVIKPIELKETFQDNMSSLDDDSKSKITEELKAIKEKCPFGLDQLAVRIASCASTLRTNDPNIGTNLALSDLRAEAMRDGFSKQLDAFRKNDSAFVLPSTVTIERDALEDRVRYENVKPGNALSGTCGPKPPTGKYLSYGTEDWMQPNYKPNPSDPLLVCLNSDEDKNASSLPEKQWDEEACKKALGKDRWRCNGFVLSDSIKKFSDIDVATKQKIHNEYAEHRRATLMVQYSCKEGGSSVAPAISKMSDKEKCTKKVACFAPLIRLHAGKDVHIKHRRPPPGLNKSNGPAKIGAGETTKCATFTISKLPNITWRNR